MMPWIVAFFLIGCLIAIAFLAGLVFPRLFGIFIGHQKPEETMGTLGDVEAQVARLFDSPSRHLVLVISNQFHRHCLRIDRTGDRAQFEFYFHSEWEAARENRVRALFAEEGIPATVDNIWSREYRYGSTRHLVYTFSKDVSAITRVVFRLLQEIERFEAGDTLAFVRWEVR